MSWKNFFKKKKSKSPDPITDLTLSNLKTGFMVDFDMKTWMVEASHYYDWGAGDITYEWQLKSYDDVIYLEREPNDEDYWCISRKIPMNSFDLDIRKHITENGDPPEQIVFEGINFNLDESGGGLFYQDSKGTGKEVLTWDYMDKSGKKLLSIEQWGETEFEASIGEPVQEYQFTNILPSSE